MNAWHQPPRINGKKLTFGLASQRILHLRSTLPTRKELLSRPLHNNKPLDAMRFFTDIKEKGMEVHTDLHVLHCIQHQIPSIHESGTTIHHINISAVTLVDHRFLAQVESLLQNQLWRPNNICWEITELEQTPNIPAVIHTCRWLIDLGFHIALDDYEPGNPYEPLLSYPLPWLVKLDKSLHQRTEVLVRVIEMLKQRELHIVVEGIENIHQLRFCIDHDIEYVQGYFIERPQELNCRTSRNPPLNPEPDGVHT